MHGDSLFKATTTKSSYLVFLFINGTGTVLMFMMSLILYHTIEVGIGHFNINLFTPYSAFCLCPFSLFTLLNGMRCFRDKDKRRKSVWYWFLYLKGFLILGLFGCGIHALMECANTEYIKKLLKGTMEQYEGHSGSGDITNAWNDLQRRHNCCGVAEYSDWQEVPFGAFILAAPQSCCLYGSRKEHDCGLNMLPKHEFASDHINTKGCFDALFGTTYYSLLFTGLLMILLGIIHTFTLTSSFLVANVNLVQDRSRQSQELQELHKMYEPDTQTRNKIYRQHLYKDYGFQ